MSQTKQKRRNLNVQYVQVKDVKIPIVGVPNSEGRLTEEDYKATLKLNRHYIQLAAEILAAENELNLKGGSLRMVQEGGIVKEIIQAIKFLAPILKPAKDKFVKWYDKKYEDKTGNDAYALGPLREDVGLSLKSDSSAGYLKPNQEMDYTLAQLRKHLKGSM